MRFKHKHKNPIYTRQCWSFHFDYSIHIYDRFRLMIPPLLSFGNVPTHFTIRSPIMTDVVWFTSTCGITYSVSHHDGCRLVHPDMWYYLFGLPSLWMPLGAPRHVVLLIRSPIMTNAIWCTPTCGITYSVSHHDGCRLVHPNMWYQLNAIRHQDGCRLVHLAKWDISSMPYALMTDADWCIPPSETLENFGVPS